jgi:hypothetical protein
VPQPIIPERKTITGSESGDAFIAVLIVAASILFFGIGLLAGPVLYYSLRESRPAFAKAAGTTSLVIAALMLGALVICALNFSETGSHH